MDRITLRGIRAFGRHGADPGERDAVQPIDVDLTVDLALDRAMASDDLADTLDYAHLHARVVSVVTETSFALLERLAAEILDAAFDDARALRAEVSLRKPGILGGATPGVTIARENPRHPRA